MLHPAPKLLKYKRILERHKACGTVLKRETIAQHIGSRTAVVNERGTKDALCAQVV